MRAGAYQRLVPASAVIAGPEASSMNNSGFAAASVAKKKSVPCPTQAVPSFRSLASKVALIAEANPGLDALAMAINSTEEDLCGAVCPKQTAAVRTSSKVDRRIS